MALLITISTFSTLRAHGAKEEVLLRKLFLQFFSTVLIPATLEFHCHEMSQNTGCLASVSGQREEKKKKKIKPLYSSFMGFTGFYEWFLSYRRAAEIFCSLPKDETCTLD